MKNIILFFIFFIICYSLKSQSFGDQMGSFNGVTTYYNPSGYISNVYNYYNGINTGMRWQCVEYVNRYYLQIYGINIRIPGQNAIEYYSNAAQRGLDAYPNGGSIDPQVGDLLCLGGNTYGHVAIIREVNTTNIKVIHQNTGNADPVSYTFPRNGNTINGAQLGANYFVQGWLRKPTSGTTINIMGSILAVAYPTSQGSNILVNGQQKNISFTIKNISSSTVTRSFRLYLVDGVNYSIIWEKENVTLTPNQTISYNRTTDNSLGTTVNTSSGQYQLLLKGGSGSLSGISMSSSTVACQYSGCNPQDIEIISSLSGDDFYIENTTITPTTVTAGETIEVSSEQCFTGSTLDADMSSSYLGYYLSTNTSFSSSSDIYLDSDPSSLGSDDPCNTENAILTIPSGLNPGTYYILFVADHDNSFTETNESNNVSYEQITVGSVSSGDDIYIENTSVTPITVTAGETIEVSCDQYYSGNTLNTDLDDPYVGFFLSTNMSFGSSDIYLGENLSSIGSDDLYDSESTALTIPVGTSSGTYYILFVADYTGLISESNENNNVSYVQITIGSGSSGDDFTVENCTASTSIVTSGELIQVNSDQCYSGNTLDANLSTCNLGYYLSTNTSFNSSSDIFLGSDGSGLGNDDPCNSESADLIIPSETEPGTYYLLFVADYNNYFSETNEDNNVCFIQITVNGQTGTCVVCPSYDITITPNSSWQTTSSSIEPYGCYIYKIPVPSTPGYIYTFKTGCGDGATANYDTYLELLDSNCNLLMSNDDDISCETNTLSTLTWTSTYSSANAIYLKVTGYDNASGDFTLAYKRDNPCTPPAQPGSISGNTSVCQGVSQTYTISSISGATSYTWSLPSGWSGSSSSTSITCTPGASSGTISVTANNSCGSSSQRTLSVIVSTTPAQPETISGNTSVINGNTNTYSISSVSGAITYTWTYSGSGNPNGTGTSITLTPFTSGILSVIANNNCGSSPTRTLNISVSTPSTFAISTSSSPSTGGITSGGGTYTNGSSCSVTATPNSGYIFTNWTENGAQVSTNASYTFTVSGNRTLVANFMQSGQTVDLNNGLIAYYPFNCNNVEDLSGSGYHGTIMGSPTFVSGIKGNCISLIGNGYTNSSGDHVLLPTIDFNNLTNFSINIWVYEQGLTSTDGEAYINYGIDGNKVSISHEGNNLLFSISDTSIAVPFNNNYLNNWVFYSLVYSNGTFRAYINGTLVGTNARNINISTTNAAIARHWWYSTSTRFIGKIDDVRIYNRSLNELELQTLSNPELITSNGLIAYYPFNGNANDVSGNSNNGTLHGSTTAFVQSNFNLSVKLNNINHTSWVDVNDYVSLPNFSINDFSVSFWMKFHLNAGYQNHTCIPFSIGNATENCNGGFNIGVESDGRISSTIIPVSGTNTGKIFDTISSDIWYHVLTVVDGDRLYFYLNGLLIDTLAINTNHNFSNLAGYVGLSKWYCGSSSASRFNGEIDELRIYNRPLSNTEIFQIYQESINTSGLPAAAGIISGDSAVCQGQTSVTYTVPPIANATSYVWTIPNGATGTSTTNSITLNYGTSAVSGNISVKGVNSCGEGAISTLSITVNSIPQEPVLLSQNISFCPYEEKTLSVSTAGNVSDYTWILPNTFNGFSNSDSISVIYSSYYQIYNNINILEFVIPTIYVIANNICGSSTPLSIYPHFFQNPPLLGMILGDTVICQGQSSIAYTAPFIIDSTTVHIMSSPINQELNNYSNDTISYIWTLPNGWTGNSSTNSITCTPGLSGGTITLTAFNACGASIQRSIDIDVITVPQQSGTISGNTSVCPGSSQTYSVTNVSGVTYNWTFPSGWTQTAGGTTNSVTVTAGSGNGNIIVTPSNSCGYGTARSLAVNTFDINFPSLNLYTDQAAAPSNVINVTTDQDAKFYIKVDACSDLNRRAQIQFQVYKDGVALTDFGQFLTDQYLSVSYFTAQNGITYPNPNNTYYNPIASGTFPYANTSQYVPWNGFFVNLTTNAYNWFYMHFFNNRYITVDINAFSQPGVYSIVYNLVGADTNCNITDNSSNYAPGFSYGGSGFQFCNNTTVLASNTMTINVSGAPIDQEFSIQTTSNPSLGGTTSGGGTFTSGSSRTVTANANSGYTFSNWTENGNVVSNNATYSFVLTNHRNLVANFICNLPLPAAAGSISGVGNVCQGDSSITYAVSLIPNATFYVWTLPDGVTGNSSTNSIIVHYGTNAISGSITVKGINGCGEGAVSVKSINVNPIPGFTGLITGDTIVCQGQTSVIYTIPPVENAAGYTWNMPTGATGASTSNTISIWYRSYATSGNITVYGRNACAYGNTSSISITVNPLPVAAGIISGNATVCQEDSSVVYSIPDILNATSYIWTLPDGATGSSSTNSINVSYGTTAVSGNISVKGTNECGDGIVSSKAIIVKPLPTAAGPISGNVNVCQGQNTVTYTVPSIPNATSYVWTLPTGAIGNSTTNSILLDFSSTSISGNLTVRGINSCGEGLSSSLEITVNPLPEAAGIISGDSIVCQGENLVLYSVPSIAYATAYLWHFPNGEETTTISNSILLNFYDLTVSGNINVRGINSCGEGLSSNKEVIFHPLPSAAGPISGDSIVCQGQLAITYTVAPILNAISYVWTLPNGVTETTLTNTITINYELNATSGILSVKGLNLCGFGAVSTKEIIVNALPADAGIITGKATVCQGQTEITYTVPTITNAQSYLWTLPTGATGTSSTNSITVSYNTTAVSGNITVKGTNTCGEGIVSSKAITVKPLPEIAGIITGNSTVCQGQSSVTYTVPSITNANSYLWTLPDGAIGNSTTNTISLDFSSTAISGNLTVRGINSCGEGLSSSFAIIVNPLPAAAGIISGNSTVCQGQNAITYTVPSITNATSYIWTLPSGATGSSTTNTISVNYGTTAVSGNITVKGTNACGEGLASNISIFVNSLPEGPGVISGPNIPCENSTVTYSVNNQTTIYDDWFLPSKDELDSIRTKIYLFGLGGFGDGNGYYWTSTELDQNYALFQNFYWNSQEGEVKWNGQNMSFYPIRAFNSSSLYQIRDIGPAGGLIFHIKNNDNNIKTYYEVSTNGMTADWGCSGTTIGATGTVIGTGLSNTLAIINGCSSLSNAARLCYDYSVTINNPIIWSVPAGWTITNGQGTNQIEVIVGSNNGTISATANNSCGNGQSSNLLVTVNPLPVTAGIISGNPIVCQGDSSVQYSVQPIANATSYVWTLPNGATGSSSTNSITVSYGTTAVSGNITVKGSNSCGDGVESTKAITVKNRSTTTISAIVCNSYTAPDGQIYTTSGTKTAIIPNVSGCDSTITINLTVNQSTSSTINPTVCDSYIAPDGQIYTTSGTKTAIIPNVSGCDSTITINLTVNQSSSSTINTTVCDSYIAPDGQIYNTSGTKTAILTNSLGCDSTITINLIVNQSSSSTINEIVCNTYTAPDGQMYTTSGTKTAIIPNAVGCDSTITINLTVKQSTSSTINATVCDTYTAPDGQIYTSSGVKTAIIPNNAGCDSVITINLTVNQSSSSSINATVCDSYTAPDGQIYTTSGTKMAIIPNNAGCDSTISINLIVKQSTSSTINPTVCDNYTAPDGQIYTTSGIKTAIIPNNAGCDSTITINLTVNQSSSSSINATVCDSYTAPDGQIYTTSGTKTAILTNSLGCDSLITINLTVNQSSSSIINATACNSYTAPDGQIYTTSSIQTAIIPNNAGCDSTITINLTVNQSSSSTINTTVCDSYTAPDGQIYTTSGTKTAIIPNVSGCDSTITINLIVNYSHVTPTIILYFDRLISSSQDGNQWYNQNGLIPNETNQELILTENGTYFVIVTQNECPSDSSNLILVNNVLVQKFDKNVIIINPNPFTDQLNINNLTTETYQYYMYNGIGQILFKGILESEVVLNTSDLAKGLYIIKFVNSLGQVYYKVVKQ